MENKELLKIYLDEKENFNFSHPKMNVASILTIIGYMEKVKMDLLKSCEEFEEK